MPLGITYIGHSCFILKTGKGKRIVMDPFNPTVGSLPQDLQADIVTVSHQHYDHNYVQGVKGKFTVVDTPGLHDFDGLRIIGISAWHDDQMGAKRGPNTIYIVESDGVRICHLGDLGSLPSKDELLRLEHIDMLLIPVGGTYTIDPAAADKLVSLIRPRIAMPMHYNMEPGLKHLLHLNAFTDGKDGIEYAPPGEYLLEIPASSDRATRYLVLKPNA